MVVNGFNNALMKKGDVLGELSGLLFRNEEEEAIIDR